VASLLVLLHLFWPAFPERLYMRTASVGMCEVCGAELTETSRTVVFLKAAPTVVATPSQMTEVLTAHGAVGAHLHRGRYFCFQETNLFGWGSRGCGMAPKALESPMAAFVGALYTHVDRATGDLWRDRILARSTERAAKNAVEAAVKAAPGMDDTLFAEYYVGPQPGFLPWWEAHAAEMEATFLAGR
jgi:hypothetical protein